MEASLGSLALCVDRATSLTQTNVHLLGTEWRSFQIFSSSKKCWVPTMYSTDCKRRKWCQGCLRKQMQSCSLNTNAVGFGRIGDEEASWPPLWASSCQHYFFPIRDFHLLYPLPPHPSNWGKYWVHESCSELEFQTFLKSKVWKWLPSKPCSVTCNCLPCDISQSKSPYSGLLS